MKLAYEVRVNGTVFTDWSRLEVARGGTNVSVTIQSADPYWTAPLGGILTVKIGRELSSGPEFVELVDGRIVGKSRVQRWQADALKVLVDGTDARLLISPEEELVLRHETIEDILRRVYVDELGFADLRTNLPDGKIEDFRVPRTQSYHQAAQALLGGLSPKSWRDPISDTWIVMDTRRPIPAGWPVRELPLRSTVVISDDTPPPKHINQVRIFYNGSSEMADETGQHPFVEITRPVEADKAPPGFARSKTVERVRLYHENLEDPTEVTRDPIIATIKEDFDGEGNLILRTETTYEYLAGTFDTLVYRMETDKYVRATLPGGDVEVVRARYEDQRNTYKPTGVGREQQIVSRYGKVSGEILEPDSVPLDDGARDGLTGEDARQTTRFGAIEHWHESITETGGQTVTCRTVYQDLPPKGVKTQWSRDQLGNARSTPEPKRAEYLLEDDASIADASIGRRPEVSFDGIPYGRELSREIVESHLFGGFANVPRTGTAELDVQDPTWREGIIIRTTDRQGGEGLWLVELVSDELAPAQNTSSTRLTLTELREEA